MAADERQTVGHCIHADISNLVLANLNTPPQLHEKSWTFDYPAIFDMTIHTTVENGRTHLPPIPPPGSIPPGTPSMFAGLSSLSEDDERRLEATAFLPTPRI